MDTFRTVMLFLVVGIVMLYKVESLLHDSPGFEYIERPAHYPSSSHIEQKTDSIVLCDEDSCAVARYSVLRKLYPLAFKHVPGKTSKDFRESNISTSETLSLRHSVLWKIYPTNAHNVFSLFPHCNFTTPGAFHIGPSDMSSPCRTYRSTFYTGDCVNMNVQKNLCFILSIGVKEKQFVTKGVCGTHVYGVCSGSCIVETSLVSLVAWNLVTNTVGFNAFPVDSYCSCKRHG